MLITYFVLKSRLEMCAIFSFSKSIATDVQKSVTELTTKHTNQCYTGTVNSHNICSKCPPFVRIQALRRLRHSSICQELIAPCLAKRQPDAASTRPRCLFSSDTHAAALPPRSDSRPGLDRVNSAATFLER